MTFTDRRVGTGHEDPRTIRKNSLNWRTHDPEQREAMRAILGAVGWVSGVIINVRTGNLIDGEMRVDEAIQNGEERIPVDYVDLSTNEEAIVLATYDSIGRKAGTSKEDLEKLLHEANTTDARVQSYLASMAEAERIFQSVPTPRQQAAAESSAFLEGDSNPVAAGEIDPPKGGESTAGPGLSVAELLASAPKPAKEGLLDISDELPGALALKIGINFDSNDPFGIPDLLPSMLGEIPEGIDTWAGPDASDPNAPFYFYNYGSDSVKGLDMSRTVVGFYVDDVRFEGAYNTPDTFAAKILNRGPMACVTPNYSIYTEDPLILQLYSLFRSRWVGRYWQEAGIKVIPDVQPVTPRFNEEYLLRGIPKNAPCIAMQIHTNFQRVRGAELEAEQEMDRKAITTVIDKLTPDSIFLYGGDRTEEILGPMRFPSSLKVIVVQNRMQKRRPVMAAAEKRRKEEGF